MPDVKTDVKLTCPRHGDVPSPVSLPGDDREFCPVCLADLLHRSSVHILERVRLAPDPELKQPRASRAKQVEPASAPPSSSGGSSGEAP